MLSHSKWVESITHPCPECDELTVFRYCTYKCGLKAKEREVNGETKHAKESKRSVVHEVREEW